VVDGRGPAGRGSAEGRIGSVAGRNLGSRWNSCSRSPSQTHPLASGEQTFGKRVSDLSAAEYDVKVSAHRARNTM
jgi:hypothetical protein